METNMSVQYPVVPVAGSALLRALASVVALIAHWFKVIARARRNRRDAAVLAGADRRMLADIGITRADVRDAFSEPFWDDPTALLRERALERRVGRALARAEMQTQEPGFRRPPTARPASQVI